MSNCQRKRRALILCWIIGLSVLALGNPALLGTASAGNHTPSDRASLTVGTNTAEFSTAHWWELTAGQNVDAVVEYIHLNYSDTGTNVSEVADLDVDEINIHGGIGENISEEVNEITAEKNDQVLNITLEPGEEQFQENDTIKVQTFDHHLTNPPNGTHNVSIELYDNNGLVDSAYTNFSTVEADAVANNPIADEISDHIVYRSLSNGDQIEAIGLKYPQADFSEDTIAFTPEFEITIDGEHFGGNIYRFDQETLILEPWNPIATNSSDDVAIELNDGILNPKSNGTYEVHLQFYNGSIDQQNAFDSSAASLDIYEGAYLNGTISDATNNSGVSGVTIEVRNEQREVDWRFDEVLDETTTSDTGAYSLYLPNGSIVEQLETERKFYEDIENTSPADYIGQQNFDLDLERRGIITGSVTNEFGSLIRHDTVHVKNDTEEYEVLADTGEDGNYSAEVDPAFAPFTVEIHPPEHKLTNETSGDVAVFESDVVDLNVSHQSDQQTVAGTITDAFGNPLTDGRVVVRNESARGIGLVVEYTSGLDSNGNYSITVPGNTTHVETDIDGYADESVLVEPTNESVDFALDPVVNLQGTVTNPDGDPIEGVGVSVFLPQKPGTEGFQETTENGTYSIDIDTEEGQFYVHVSDPDEEYVDQSERDVTLVPGQPEHMDFELSYPARITGTVTDNTSGSSIAGVRLETWDGTFTTFENTMADRDGEFEFHVEPGTFDVRAFDSAFEDPAYSEEIVTGIEVGKNETVDVGTIELGEPGFIEGSVTDVAGDPAVQAIVVADDGDGPSFDVTDGAGEYKIDASPGEYRMMVFKGNETSDVKEIDLDGGETVSDVNFSLHRVEVINSSIKTDDSAVDASDLGVNVKVQGGLMTVQVINETDPPEGNAPAELEGMNVTAETTFDINITATNYTPSTLLWGAGDVEWETTENESDPQVNTTDISISVTPINLQIIHDNDLSAGPLIDRSPQDIEWPSDEDDQADLGFNQTVYFGLDDMSTAPPELRDQYEGLTVATNAQLFESPSIENDSLQVWVSGPNRTVGGLKHDGFYRAFISDVTLDEWGIDDPEEELETLYQGDPADFTVESVDDGAWIELANLSYSAGYVEIEANPSEDEPDEDTDDSDDAGSSGGSSSGPEPTPTPTPTTTPESTATPTATQTPEPTTTAPTPEPTTPDQATSTDRRTTEPTVVRTTPDATTAQTVETTTPEQPGFGVTIAVIALLCIGMLAIRRHR